MKIIRFRTVLVLLLAIAFVSLIPSTKAFGAKKYNWAEEKADSWKIETLNTSQISVTARYTPAKKYGKGTTHIPEGYYVQGGTVTEQYYVFSVYKNDNSKNYIYIANRSDGKIIKTISGNWGHMNSFYYDWGSGQVRILNMKNGKKQSASKDGCLDLATLKMRKDGDCASKRSPDYGVKGLTGQGEAQADGYVYVLGWDGGAELHPNQTYAWQRNDNIIFVYEKGTKKLIKSFYIPKGVVNGEVEDISIDGNGDVYLFYAQLHKDAGKQGAAFYKIPASVIGTTKDHNAPGYGGDSSLAPEEVPTEEQKNSKKCSTSVLSDAYCDTGGSGPGGDMSSINGILQLVVTILSGGVGIGGTIGIVWSGIIIMTSRDNSARLALGKKRLLEIVVGLALYAVAAGMILWLIPG